jgi:hypothetical protein
MATSSITGGERAAERADGRDVDLLGPSDSSDSGSDDAEDGADIAPDRVEGGRRGDVDGEIERLAGAQDVELPTDLDGDGEDDELATP